MAISSVPPPGGHAIGQESLVTLAQRKNGIGHGSVISDINTQGSKPSQASAPAAGNTANKVGGKVDKLV
jgi:hypothetical protein